MRRAPRHLARLLSAAAIVILVGDGVALPAAAADDPCLPKAMSVVTPRAGRASPPASVTAPAAPAQRPRAVSKAVAGPKAGPGQKRRIRRARQAAAPAAKVA